MIFFFLRERPSNNESCGWVGFSQLKVKVICTLNQRVLRFTNSAALLLFTLFVLAFGESHLPSLLLALQLLVRALAHRRHLFASLLVLKLLALNFLVLALSLALVVFLPLAEFIPQAQGFVHGVLLARDLADVLAAVRRSGC